MALGEQFGEMILNVLILAVVLASPVVLACVIIDDLQERRRIAVSKTKSKIDSFCSATNAPGFGAGRLYVGLLLLLFYIIEDPQAFNDPLKITNLLYQSTADNSLHGGAEKVARLLVDGDTTQLNSFFTDALLFEVKAVILLLLAWQVTAAWPTRPLLVAPFIIVFMLYTIFLPMLYGVLKQQIRFPVITLSSGNELLSKSTGKLFLLNKNDQEFVVWDSIRKKVLWIPKGEVKAAVVGQAERVFTHLETTR